MKRGVIIPGAITPTCKPPRRRLLAWWNWKIPASGYLGVTKCCEGMMRTCMLFETLVRETGHLELLRPERGDVQPPQCGERKMTDSE